MKDATHAGHFEDDEVIDKQLLAAAGTTCKNSSVYGSGLWADAVAVTQQSKHAHNKGPDFIILLDQGETLDYFSEN